MADLQIAFMVQEKKKVVDPKEESNTAAPTSVFELSALQGSLPADAAAADAETAPGPAVVAAAGEVAGSQGTDTRPVKGGRGAGAGPQGGRGPGRGESGERWSKETPRGGRGGGGRGPGRTVEVTGSYVIEKPADDDESSSRGGGKGPKNPSGPAGVGAVGKKGPPRDSREEGARGFAGKPSKPAPSSSSSSAAREPREPRHPRAEGAAATGGDAVEGHAGPGKEGARPKSTGNGPNNKLFDTAMKQANPKLKKVSGFADFSLFYI